MTIEEAALSVLAKTFGNPITFEDWHSQTEFLTDGDIDGDKLRDVIEGFCNDGVARSVKNRGYLPGNDRTHREETNHAREHDQGRGRDSVQPVDLQAVIDAGLERIEPEVFWRRDARALLYRRKLNVVFGSPEAGKTWVALMAGVALVNDAARTGKGIVMVFFDFEDDPRSYLTRMRDAGAPLADVVTHTRYYSINTPITTVPPEYEGASSADLVVIDTTNSAMTLDDLDPLSNKDALVFINDVRALRKGSDAAWLLLDHEPISTGAGRKQAIGAQSKLGAVDGAQYRAVAVEQPRPGHRGAIGLYVTKDRPGGVRQYADKPNEHGIQHAGTLFLNPVEGTTRFTFELIEPQGVEGDAILKSTILDVAEDWSSKNQIWQLVRGTGLKRRNDTINDAIEKLAADDALEQKPKGNYVVYRKDSNWVLPDAGRTPSPRIGENPTAEDVVNVDATRAEGFSPKSGESGERSTLAEPF